MACYHNDDKFGDDFEKDEIMNFSDDNDENFSVDEDITDADGGVGRGFREISWNTQKNYKKNLRKIIYFEREKFLAKIAIFARTKIKRTSQVKSWIFGEISSRGKIEYFAESLVGGGGEEEAEHRVHRADVLQVRSLFWTL